VSRDPRLFLEDIQFGCKKILRYTAGMEFNDFVLNELTYDAVIRNLEIIGEAARNVPSEICEKHPEVEWRAMAALRNIVAHEYFGVKEEIIWEIVSNKIGPLLNQVTNILAGMN
jgi:uncharacterized protein with HEPN domain